MKIKNDVGCVILTNACFAVNREVTIGLRSKFFCTSETFQGL